jgi:hypothetical protein
VTTDLRHVIHVVPVGPGPSLVGAEVTGGGGCVVMTVVLGAVGGTKPAGGGGLLPKYDGGGAGFGIVCSYGGGRPILFSTETKKIRIKNNDNTNCEVG